MLDCDDAAARLLFWNPDGTPLDTCGSATRGVADLLMREAGASSVTLRTARGRLSCGRDIPLAEAADTPALPLPGHPAACSMGNPHCTFFVDDLDAIDIAAIGPGIETPPLFRNRTNVHFVRVVHRGRIRLRIWERGGGVPLGSGSCCCGAVVGGIRRGLLDDTVEMECDGATVTVRWDGVGGVVLTGLVEPVFSGVIGDWVWR